ncbi:MAG: carbohydrate binding domain-containing protein [Armatimonadota bacterium]
MRTALLVLVAALAFQFTASCSAAVPRKLDNRWLFVMKNMGNPDSLAETLALLPRAQAAGYNAIVLSDGHLYEAREDDGAYRENVLKLQAEARSHGLDLIPCVMPIGYSGSITGVDRNLAEGMPVKDALFLVHGGVANLVPDPPVSLPNGGFENANGDLFAGWDMQDYPGQSTFADHQVFRSGSTSVRMENIPQADPKWGHCRFSRTIAVKPFRQYHISAWIKTEDFEAPRTVNITVLAPTEQERSLCFAEFDIRPTQDWTQYHIVFNSLNFDEVRLYFGTWDGKAGRIWWDDVQVEEIGLHNLLRRDGCPLEVRGEDGAVYQEGIDFEPVRDPELQPGIQYHTPPAGILLTPNSRIKDNQRLRVSYYHSVVIGDWQIMCCLSDPKVYDILRQQVQRVEDLLHPSAFFMQHDEIRVGNWDKACQDRHLTPGQILADNVSKCTQIIKDISPTAKVWVWSDMFDPMHNAVDNYYLVNGTWAGSWEGLRPEVGIVNWAGHLKGKNCAFFADRGHEQVLAGYYDGDRDGAAILEWLRGTSRVPRITGAMYTTWRQEYQYLEPWALAAWGNR